LPKASIAVAKLSQTRQITDHRHQIKLSIDHFGDFGAAVRAMDFTPSPGLCLMLLGFQAEGQIKRATGGSARISTVRLTCLAKDDI